MKVLAPRCGIAAHDFNNSTLWVDKQFFVRPFFAPLDYMERESFRLAGIDLEEARHDYLHATRGFLGFDHGN
jgi:hypothetical protein